MFLDKPVFRQRVQILGRCLSAHTQISLDIFDACIGVAEQVVQQFLTVDLWKLGPHAMFHIGHLIPDAHHDFDGRGGGLGHGVKHVDDPVFPSAVITHGLEVPIVVRLIPGDEARQIEHGDVQKPRAGQIKHIQDAANPAIAIGKRVDAFELMVDQRHFDQRVEGVDFHLEVSRFSE